ncbi:MAG: hypothetical protein LBF38_08135 [Deltaproteobacteria bacterium]|jgi:hypothetical protein|nr:hypothetical protein [Deltaproteobacteria bacterium]
MGKKNKKSKSRKPPRSQNAKRPGALAERPRRARPARLGTGGIDVKKLNELYAANAFGTFGYSDPSDLAPGEIPFGENSPGLYDRPTQGEGFKSIGDGNDNPIFGAWEFWEVGDWPNFLGFLDVHGDDPRLSAWLMLKPYALYNHLTRVLFEEHDYGSAIDLAQELAGSCDGLDGSLFKDCAAITLDSLNVLSPGYQPVKIDTKLRHLPDCWAKMRSRQTGNLGAEVSKRFEERKTLVAKLDQGLPKMAQPKINADVIDFANLAESLVPMAFGLDEASVFLGLNELARLYKMVYLSQPTDFKFMSFDLDRLNLNGLKNALAQIESPAVSTMANVTFSFLDKNANTMWLDSFKVWFLAETNRMDGRAKEIHRYLASASTMSKYHGLQVMSQWPLWSSAEKCLLASLAMDALSQRYHDDALRSTRDNANPQKSQALKKLVKTALALEFNELVKTANLCLYDRDPFGPFPARVFGEFADFWPSLFMPLGRFSPMLDSLSHDVLVKLWLFSDKDTSLIDDYLAQRDIKLLYPGKNHATRLAENCRDYFKKIQTDDPDRLLARLNGLKDLSHRGSFEFLLESVLTAALSQCRHPLSNPKKNVGFFLFCAKHKNFFIENMPETPNLALLKLINPDKTLNQRFLPAFGDLVANLKDGHDKESFAHMALYLLASCRFPDPLLMDRLFLAALPRFAIADTYLGKFLDCLMRNQETRDFRAILAPISRTLTENLVELQKEFGSETILNLSNLVKYI